MQKSQIRYLLLSIVLNLSLCTSACNSAYQPIEPGAKINDYELQTIDGGKVQLAKLLTGKVTLLHFWASWCITCAEELPQLKQFHDSYSDQGINVIGIVVQDTKENISAMQKQYGITFPILFDPSEKMIPKFKLEGLPETFIVDANEKLVLFPDPVGDPTVRIMGNREWLDPDILRIFKGIKK